MTPKTNPIVGVILGSILGGAIWIIVLVLAFWR